MCLVAVGCCENVMSIRRIVDIQYVSHNDYNDHHV